MRCREMEGLMDVDVGREMEEKRGSEMERKTLLIDFKKGRECCELRMNGRISRAENSGIISVITC